MTSELIQAIEEKLLEKWSPEQISGWLADNERVSPIRVEARNKLGRGFIKNLTGIEDAPQGYR